MLQQKKKPRQRNRPKNKANRQETSSNEINENLKLNIGQHDVCPNAINLPEAESESDVKPKSTFDSESISDSESEPVTTGKLDELDDSTLLVTEQEQQQQKQQQQQQKKVRLIKKDENKNTTKTAENLIEKNAFIANLQKQMENVIAKGNTDLPQALLGNLQKLLDQEPISDVESSGDEQEYIEYVYKPRTYFLSTLCNFCKIDLLSEDDVIKCLPCKHCHLCYYCTAEHMKLDAKKHRQVCQALQQIADGCGGHIFYKCGAFSAPQFRSYRIITIRSVESIIDRPLTAEEQEMILFPRICCEPSCREFRYDKLKDCKECGQIAYCHENLGHYNESHKHWCRSYQIFKELILLQQKFGRFEPSLPAKILKDLPGACCNTKQILQKLNFDLKDSCEYAALSQISTGPLTAWFALKLCGGLKKPNGQLIIHLIGAEIEFEVDMLLKWELFFLHIAPAIKKLVIVFVGPELNPRNISFEQLKKTKCCRECRKIERTLHFDFECKFYHDYRVCENFLPPDLVCFFNAGLYRATGYQLEDTWPDTILAASNLKCPIIVTSYTEYEAPLDMKRFIQESNRHLNVVLPPIVNPFSSVKPERNFVSDDEAPLIFKNFYCFVIE